MHPAIKKCHKQKNTHTHTHACMYMNTLPPRKWGPIRCNQWLISKRHFEKFNALNFFELIFPLFSLSHTGSSPFFHSLSGWLLRDWQNKRDCCGDTNYLMNSLFILKVPWVATRPSCYSRWKITSYETVSDTWTEAGGRGQGAGGVCAIQTCPCP